MANPLFPAHAGVILLALSATVAAIPFPRPRGGDPNSFTPEAIHADFSPPTRGSTLTTLRKKQIIGLS